MIDKRFQPRLSGNKEYESNVGMYRVAAGMTMKELAEASGTDIGVISALQNGMAIPYYELKSKRGQIKPYVEKMRKIFEEKLGVSVSHADLFPRYICDIERLKIPEGREPFVSSQLEEFYWSANYTNLNDLPERLEIREEANRALATLTQREEAVLRKRYYEDLTQEEIADSFSICKARVGQIEAKALRKLRHPTRSWKLRILWKD